MVLREIINTIRRTIISTMERDIRMETGSLLFSRIERYLSYSCWRGSEGEEKTEDRWSSLGDLCPVLKRHLVTTDQQTSSITKAFHTISGSLHA